MPRTASTFVPGNQPVQPQITPMGDHPNGQPYDNATQASNQYGQQYTFDSRVGNGSLPAGIQGSANRAYTRTVQGNELTANQLNALLGSDSRYIQEARLRGREGAAARGLGVLGGMGAGLAEREAIRAGLPIAESDAGAHRSAATENLAWLNQMALQGSQRVNIGSGSTGFDAEHAQLLAQQHELQMQRERLGYDGEQRGLDRAHQVAFDRDQWQRNMITQGSDQRFQRSMQREQSRLGLQDYAARTGIDMRAQSANFNNRLLEGFLAEPDVFTPDVIAGVSQFAHDVFSDYGDMFDSWFDEMFGSGYYFDDFGGY